jgi:uncharacterized protein (TIGR02391 family)
MSGVWCSRPSRLVDQMGKGYREVSSFFTQGQLRAIADALGDTTDGLSGSEIGELLAACQISDVDPTITKRHRLYSAFANDQNARQARAHVLAFIRKAMRPERFLRCPGRFEPMRALVNGAVAFAGLAIDESGVITPVEQARTLSEAQRRAQELRADLATRGVHPDVLLFCREELVVDNYFHAVLEAVKSVADKIRTRTGLTDDGNTLIDRALAGDLPMLAINLLKTESEKSEQKGFANLLRGTFGMFRNTTAHEARIHWPIGKDDAEDLLSLVSLIHRRLDAAHMPPRT